MRLHTTAVVLALALVACHRPAERAPAPAPVTRVISLAASTTEILFAVGAGDAIVGVDQYSDFPEAAQKLPRVGSELAPSLERIIALRPDVVFVASTANGRELAAQLERLHIRVVATQAVTLEDVLGDIARVAAVVGHEAQAAVLVTRLRARLAAVRAEAAGRLRPRALVVVWPDPLTVAGGGSFVHEALTAAGGDDVAGDTTVPYPRYSIERLLARAPEVIIIGSHSGSPSPAPLARFSSLPAVRDHRVFELDGDLLFRPGPRLVDGVERLARLLQPVQP